MGQKGCKPLFQAIKANKDLVGVRYMHIAWNEHVETVSLRREEKGFGGDGGKTFRHIVKGVHGTKRLITSILGN